MSTASQGLLISNLSFGYGDPPLFEKWSMHLPVGLTWIHGDEGSGKSTLLRLLSSVLSAQAGELCINGTCLQNQPEAYRAQAFWAEPHSEVFDTMSPLEYFDSLRLHYPYFNTVMLTGLQQALDLTVHLEKKLFMLSNGSKRKVWLAAAFASGAALTLIDNPFAALDRSSIKVVGELLEDATEHPTRVFVVADYEIPEGLSPKKIINLSPRPASH
jgi:ABC-type multidrug transport system ATPase subunit